MFTRSQQARHKRPRTEAATLVPLLELPVDVWTCVRECLVFVDLVALASTNRQLQQLVTNTAGFWEGFRPPDDVDLSKRHHRRFLALYRGEAARSGLRRVSAREDTGQELLRGIAVDELSLWGPDSSGVAGAPAVVRTLRLLDCDYEVDEYVLPAALAALQTPGALLHLETSCFFNEASTRAGLASCSSLQSFRIVTSQPHFEPAANEEKRPPARGTQRKTLRKLNGRPFQALENLAGLQRLELSYRFVGCSDWLRQLATFPLVEELELDPVQDDEHLERLAGLAAVSTKLRKLRLGQDSFITQEGLKCLAKFRGLRHLDLCGRLLEMDEKIDFRPLSTLPLQYLGVSFREDDDTPCLRDLLSCAPLRRVLRRLSIVDCQLTDADFAALPEDLQSLRLIRCAISQEGLAALPRGLQELTLGSETTDELSSLPCALQRLHIHGWDFRGLDDQSWQRLAVAELRFYRCLGLADELPALPAGLQRLTFDSCAELDELCLVSLATKLQGISLRELTLRNCSIRGIHAAVFAACRSLQTLTLQGCRDFDETVMNELFFREMPNLYIYWK